MQIKLTFKPTEANAGQFEFANNFLGQFALPRMVETKPGVAEVDLAGATHLDAFQPDVFESYVRSLPWEEPDSLELIIKAGE